MIFLKEIIKVRVVLLLIPLAGGLWAWWKKRNKKPDVMQVKIVDEKKNTKKKKDK